MRRPVGRARRGDESAAEATALLITLPLLIGLVLALVDIGVMFAHRMQVQQVLQATVRNIAAEGGDLNPRTHPAGDPAWSQWATDQLVSGGRCQMGGCEADAAPPRVTCRSVRPDGSSYSAAVAEKAGDTVACEVTYPYRGINEGFLNSPFGLGFGSLLGDFHLQASSRYETGGTV